MIPPRFIFRRLMISLIVLLVLSAGYPSAGGGATAQTEADAAAEFAYGLSSLERTGNWDRLYDFLHPDAKAIIPRSAVVRWYREDFAPRQPQAIVEISAVRQIPWTWPVTGVTYPNAYEVDYVQLFGAGPTYEYVSETLRLVPSGPSFGWFFGRSGAFVNEQSARFPGDVEPASQRQTQSSASAAQSSAGCTLVELYPGYPGYRGNVTGVMPHWNGLGDWACLEELEQQNPAFDRAREDRANQQAADALGINGGPHLWTWENWMLIESKRGLVPSCYTCFVLDPTTQPLRTDITPDPSDYRIRIGFVGSTAGIGGLAAAAGHPSAQEANHIAEFYGNDDYVLRAISYVTGGPEQNAKELYDEMVRWAGHPLAKSDGVRNFPSAPEILNFAIWQSGGYTWVPNNAAPGDQVVLMLYAVSTMGVTSSPQDAAFYIGELQRSVEVWIVQPGSTPLDAWMQEQHIWQEFRT